MIEHGTTATATVFGVDHFLLGTPGACSKQKSRLVHSSTKSSAGIMDIP